VVIFELLISYVVNQRPSLQTQLLSNIEAASKLEQQILEVQTKSLEEYDQYLEEVKTQLSQKRFAENEHDSEFFNEELQLENLSDEVRC